ncbi:nucleotidyltransferase family protein [Altererythrobacter lauratis]|uniref:NTP transferase domain-containing protein n=1 Tax=Alteraurantiacibacter lauratis TaxID=2054627 RepID=A0ABV7EJS7_9SPHN
MPCCPPTDTAPLVAVLAAGAGTRFGAEGYGAKLDARLAGKPVGQWVLDAVAAAGLPAGIIVVGQEAPAFASASGWPLLVNSRAAEGLGTSLALAAGRALAQGRALLVLLADMPLVEAEYIARLASAKPGAATLYPLGKRGVPACLPLALLPQVAALTGDQGAGALLAEERGLALLEPPAAMLLDIDRPDDLPRAAATLTNRG